MKTYLLLVIPLVFCFGNVWSNEDHANNNSSIGMNLSLITDRTTEYPFLNFEKYARSWLSQKRGAKWGEGGELQLDENGWVKSLKPGQSAELIFLHVDEGRLPYKRYIVRYKGKGKVEYAGQARKVRGKKFENYDIIRISDSRSTYARLKIVKTDPNDYIRDITIIPEKYIDLFDGGEIFNPDWIKKIKVFRAVRYMNWMRTTNSQQKDWKDRAKLTDSSWGTGSQGVPLEVMIELSNRYNIDPWFNIPHLATEDYILQFAKYIKEKLNPELTIYIEHSNEVWNWQMPQTHYAEKAAKNRWGKDVKAPQTQWQGMRSATMCDIWKRKVFKNEAGRVHCILGVHPGWNSLVNFSLDCPAWVKEGNEPCYKHGIDSIGITGYFTGCLNGQAGWNQPDRVDLIRGWFNDQDKGLTRAFKQIVDGQYFECNKTLKSKAESYKYFYQKAKERGLAITAYEGGQHVTGNASKTIQDDKDFINFHIKINRDDRMKKVYLENLENWKNNGGTLFMHFQDISKSSKWGSWGALEYLSQQSSPKWDALIEFNENEKCWWDGC